MAINRKKTSFQGKSIIEPHPELALRRMNELLVQLLLLRVQLGPPDHFSENVFIPESGDLGFQGQKTLLRRAQFGTGNRPGRKRGTLPPPTTWAA